MIRRALVDNSMNVFRVNQRFKLVAKLMHVVQRKWPEIVVVAFVFVIAVDIKNRVFIATSQLLAVSVEINAVWIYRVSRRLNDCLPVIFIAP